MRSFLLTFQAASNKGPAHRLTVIEIFAALNPNCRKLANSGQQPPFDSSKKPFRRTLSCSCYLIYIPATTNWMKGIWWTFMWSCGWQCDYVLLMGWNLKWRGCFDFHVFLSAIPGLLSACLALRCNRLFAIFQFFFLLKLSVVCTFWIVLMCWYQK